MNGKVHITTQPTSTFVLSCGAFMFRATPVHGSDLLNYELRAVWLENDVLMVLMGEWAGHLFASEAAQPKQKREINRWSKMIDETF